MLMHHGPHRRRRRPRHHDSHHRHQRVRCRAHACTSVASAVLAADADADVSELPAGDSAPGYSPRSPARRCSPRSATSWCASSRIFLPTRSIRSWSTSAAPVPDVALVLHHTGGQRGKAVLDKLRKAGVHEVKAEALKKWELPKWVVVGVPAPQDQDLRVGRGRPGRCRWGGSPRPGRGGRPAVGRCRR